MAKICSTPIYCVLICHGAILSVQGSEYALMYQYVMPEVGHLTCPALETLNM